jgi:hypothetical protein
LEQKIFYLPWLHTIIAWFVPAGHHFPDFANLSQIHVDDDKYDKLCTIDGMDEVLTTDPTKTRFHACRANALSAIVPKRRTLSGESSSTKRSGSNDRIDQVAGDGLVRYNHRIFGNQRVEQEMLKLGPAIFIKPSSQWFGSISDEKIKLTRGDSPISHLVDGIWHVLSSIHSSSAEIHEFVEKLRPQRIVPLVECTDTSLKSLMKRCKSDPRGTSRPTIPKSIEQVLDSADQRVLDGKRSAAGSNDLPGPKRPKIEEDSSALRSIFEPTAVPLPPESREGSADEEDIDDPDEIHIHEEIDSAKEIASKKHTPSTHVLELEAHSQAFDAEDDLLHISRTSGNAASTSSNHKYASQDILNATEDQVEEREAGAAALPAPERGISLIYDDSSD